MTKVSAKGINLIHFSLIIKLQPYISHVVHVVWILFSCTSHSFIHEGEGLSFYQVMGEFVPKY